MLKRRARLPFLMCKAAAVTPRTADLQARQAIVRTSTTQQWQRATTVRAPLLLRGALLLLLARLAGRCGAFWPGAGPVTIAFCFSNVFLPGFAAWAEPAASWARQYFAWNTDYAWADPAAHSR